MVEVGQGAAHATAQLVDKGGGIEGLAEGGVVDLTVCLEVGRQVGLGVTPAVGPDDPYLAAAQPEQLQGLDDGPMGGTPTRRAAGGASGGSSWSTRSVACRAQVKRQWAISAKMAVKVGPHCADFG